MAVMKCTPCTYTVTGVKAVQYSYSSVGSVVIFGKGLSMRTSCTRCCVAFLQCRGVFFTLGDLFYASSSIGCFLSDFLTTVLVFFIEF